MHNFAFVSRYLENSYSCFWNEYDGRRGALEITSITWKWLSMYLPANVTRLILWSDNCSAQNKNWLFFFFVGWLIYTGRCFMIDLKFLLKGHSFMRPDGVFGRINATAKGHDIELPHEWCDIIDDSGSHAIQIVPEDFIEMLPMLRGIFTIRKNDENGEKINTITTYAWYRFLKNDEGEVVMMLRSEINETIPWVTLNIQKKRGIVEHDIETLDKPYCTYADDDSLIPQKREIQLEKEWDLYDLAQEFLSDAAKQFYAQPTQPRPTKKQDEIIESDDNNLSDPEEDNIQNMYYLFDNN